MTREKAAFEVELRDSVSKPARSAASGFREVHRAASGQGIDRGTRSVAKTERALNKTDRTISKLTKTAKENPFLATGPKGAAGNSIFGGLDKMAMRRTQVAQVGSMWDSLAKSHLKVANATKKRTQAEKARSSSGSGLGAGRVMGGVAAGTAAAGAIGGIAAYQTGKAALTAIKSQDQIIRGLTVITGSASEANAVFERSVELSDRLGKDWHAISGGVHKLMGKGFSEMEATDLTKGIADLTIISPDANIDGLLLAISQIKGIGRLMGDEVLQLAEAGMPTIAFYDAMGKRLGKTREEVMGLQREGKILAEDAIPSILDALRERTGKELGMVAEEASQTVAGTMDRLATLPSRFFQEVAKELDDSNLEGSLKNLLDVLDPKSAAFSSAVENVASAVEFGAEAMDVAIPLAKEFGSAFANSFSAFTGMSDSEDFFEYWKDPDTLEKVREWGHNLGTIATSLTNILGLLSNVGDRFEAVTDVIGKPIGTFVDIKEAYDDGDAMALAGSVVDGFVNTLMTHIPMVGNAGKLLGEASISGIQAGVDAHSPSRAAAKLGLFTSQGLSVGMERGQPMVERTGESTGYAAIGGMRSSASKLGDVPTGGASAQARTQSVQMGNISLQLSNLPENATKNPQELARAIRRELEKMLDGIVQQGTIA